MARFSFRPTINVAGVEFQLQAQKMNYVFDINALAAFAKDC